MIRQKIKIFNKNILKAISILLCFIIVPGVANWSAIFDALPKSIVYANSNTLKRTLNTDEAKSLDFVPLDYIITLDYQGGERKVGDKILTSDSLEIKSNNEKHVTPPEKKGYAFYGFFSQTNAKGIKYFDAKGEMPDNIAFDIDTPRTLYAAWVNLSSGKINTLDNTLQIYELDSNKYSNTKNVDLDIIKLKELRYSKIQVNFKLRTKIESKGEGRRFWLDVGQNPNYKNVWDRQNIYLSNTELEDNYFSVAVDINEFSNLSEFRIGFNQKSNDFWVYAYWYINEASIYFTAIEQAPEKPLTVNTQQLKTTTYIIPDSKGYNVNDKTTEAHPLGGNYINYTLRYNGGELLDGGNGNYGYISDENFNGDQNPNIQVLLNYNYNEAEKINGKDWGVGYDYYSGAINDINGAGAVGSGALLVQKSTDGLNWTWENPFSNDPTQSFHTSDFVNNYSPEIYDGQSHTAMKIAPVEKRDENGNIIYKLDKDGKPIEIEYIENDSKMAYQEAYHETDGYLPIYIPSGEALKAGIFIRVSFVYELSRYTYNNGWDEFWDGFINETKVWQYINVLEETTFYISNSKAEILFQNMDFSTSTGKEESTENSQSELVRQFGGVKNGDAVNEGFKVNYNGNKSYKVRYSKNGSTLNNEATDSVYDGRIFMAPGKYDFEVTPKIGETKKTTIYINDRGLTQNLNYYFGGNLIDSDSKRLYSQIDEVPVYKAGKVKWHTNKVDANHMPIAGRIGLYKETVANAEFASKYGHEEDKTSMARFNASNFRLSSRVEVDSNYKIVPKDGYSSYRVNVEKGYKPKEGDGFEAFPKPKEISGKTYIGTIYGSIKLDDGRTIVGTISGYDIYKIASSKLDNSRAPVNGNAFTESGNYLAEFANNPKYFNSDEQVSGDIFTFIFQFRVTDEEFKPEINKINFQANIGFSDYESKYYGAKIPNKTTGNIVTFAYPDRTSAYNTAYEYVRSLIKLIDGKYQFNGKIFNNQADVLAEVDSYIIKNKLVETKYFDGSDKNSYLSYSGKPNEILTSQHVTQNVVVFDSSFNAHNNAIGTPFLNNRMFRHVDEKGNIVEGKNPVKFIQVSDYESKSVELLYKDGEKLVSYGNIPYGAEAQGYLQAKNAPSGKYVIKETNDCGENSYEGIYLRTGDNTTSIDTTRVFNSVASHQKLTKSNANSQFTVNSFLIKSATNELDPYGIIKITNTLGYKKIYQLDEVQNIKIDTQGEWKIELIDRLGNTASFFVNIYSPSIVSKLTLMNKGEVYSESYVAGGQRITLDGAKDLNNIDPNYEFVGWSDSNGKIYNGSFLCNFDKDTVLTAEYRLVSTKVSVYDGILIGEPFKTKPYEKLLLPSNLSREGLEFYGYRYNVGKEDRFCIGQLNSVPNVAELRLDAVYLDKSTGLKITSGQSLERQTKANYTFYGWGTETRGENAIVFTGDRAEFTATESLEVYALYIANEGNSPIIGGGTVSHDNFFSGLLQNISTMVSSSVQNGSLFFAFAIILFLAYLVKRYSKKGMLAFCRLSSKINSQNNFTKEVSAMRQVKQEIPKTIKPVLRGSIKKQPRTKNYVKRPKIKWSVIFSSAVCFLLVVVLGSFASDKFLYSASASYKDFKQEQAIERQLEEYENEILAQKEVQKEQDKQRSEYTLQAQNLKTQENEYVEEFDAEEVFASSLISLDLNVKGYETFSATVTKTNGEKINGIGYTNLTYIEMRDNLEYYQAGFISGIDEVPLTTEDVQNGAKIEQQIDAQFGDYEEEDYAFELVLNEKTWTDHFISFEKYCKYTVSDYNISYCAVADDPSLYDIGIGYLYNYDLSRAVYDPNLGKEFDKSAYDISAGLDYEKLLETYRTIIDYQNKNGTKIESITFTAIDVSAINEYVLHGQQEEFLGIAPEQIQFIESQVSNSSFYYIDGVTGQISVLEIPSAPPEDNSATIWNIINIVLNSLMIVGGVILCATGIGAPLGAGLIVGGVVGFVAQYFQEEIGGFFNSILGADGTQAMGGGFSVVMGGVTINIGTKLIGKGGGWGTAAAVVCFVIGAALMVFGANELVDVAFDFNIIKELTNISDSAYNNLYRALNYAATVVVVAYSTLTKYYGLVKEKKLAQSLNKSVKELRKDTPYLREAIDKLPNPEKKGAKWDLFDDAGKQIPKSELYKNGGKGYYVSKANPDVKIPIKDGFPVLDDFSKAQVKIDGGFTVDRKVNFKTFDTKLADDWALNPQNIPDEYAQWFKDNKININALKPTDIAKLRESFKLVWHEHQNTFNAQLISNSIHTVRYGGISHLGGISVLKKIEEANKLASTLNSIRSN